MATHGTGYYLQSASLWCTIKGIVAGRSEGAEWGQAPRRKKVVLSRWTLRFRSADLESFYMEHHWRSMSYWLARSVIVVMCYTSLAVVMGDELLFKAFDARMDHYNKGSLIKEETTWQQEVENDDHNNTTVERTAVGSLTVIEIDQDGHLVIPRMGFVVWHAVWCFLFLIVLLLDRHKQRFFSGSFRQRWVAQRCNLVFAIMFLDLLITSFLNPSVVRFMMFVYALLLRVQFIQTLALVFVSSLAMLSAGYVGSHSFLGSVSIGEFMILNLICILASRQIEIHSRLSLYRLWYILASHEASEKKVFAKHSEEPHPSDVARSLLSLDELVLPSIPEDPHEEEGWRTAEAKPCQDTTAAHSPNRRKYPIELWPPGASCSGEVQRSHGGSDTPRSAASIDTYFSVGSYVDSVRTPPLQSMSGPNLHRRTFGGSDEAVAPPTATIAYRPARRRQRSLAADANASDSDLDLEADTGDVGITILPRGGAECLDVDVAADGELASPSKSQKRRRQKEVCSSSTAKSPTRQVSDSSQASGMASETEREPFHTAVVTNSLPPPWLLLEGPDRFPRSPSPDTWGAASWAEIENVGLQFQLRGDQYLQDNLKVPAPPCAFSLHQVRLLRSEEALIHIADRLPSLKEFLQANSQHFFFIWNRCFPHNGKVLNAVAIFYRRLPIGDDPVFDKLFQKFVESDDKPPADFRNSRFKYLFKLTQAPSGVSRAFRMLGGTRPVILGKGGHVDQMHFSGRNYVEVDLDVSSSKMARLTCSPIVSNADKVIWDEMFVLEGQEEDELPERPLGSIRWIHVDLDKGVTDIEPKHLDVSMPVPHGGDA